MRGLMLAAVSALALADPAWGAAPRVVSLNLCADDYLLTLAPERAVAVTWLAADPALSVVAARAAGLRQVRASAEAVLALHPDLVLAADFGAQPALAAIEARGVRVVRLALPEDFSGIRRETRRLAGLLGADASGEALVAEFDRRLAAIPPAHGRALWLEPRLWSAGPGSLAFALMAAAGLTPIGGGRLGIEAVLRLAPDIAVVPPPARFPSLATDLLQHPALDSLARRVVEPALTLCAGPWSVAAAEALAQ